MAVSNSHIDTICASGACVNPVSGDVLTNDKDVDSGGLNVAQVDGSGANVDNPVAGLYGTLTLHADGTYDYTLDNANPQVQALDSGQTLTDSFTYVMSDGQGGMATATVTIIVNPSKAGTLTNTASVTASTPDPDAANNSSTATTTVVPR